MDSVILTPCGISFFSMNYLTRYLLFSKTAEESAGKSLHHELISLLSQNLFNKCFGDPTGKK